MAGQRSNQGHTMKLDTYNLLMNVPIKYQLPTPFRIVDILCPPQDLHDFQ